MVATEPFGVDLTPSLRWGIVTYSSATTRKHTRSRKKKVGLGTIMTSLVVATLRRAFAAGLIGAMATSIVVAVDVPGVANGQWRATTCLSSVKSPHCRCMR